MTAPPTAWFDQVDLDPATHPVSMGTRALGARPWLITDEKRAAELALKRELFTHDREAVLHTTARCEQPSHEVIALLSQAGTNIDDRDLDRHPLEAAALSVQEDLVLLDRRISGWHLNSAALCFPTRWRLADKVNRHIADVHGPVDGYDPRITNRVDRLFDRLTDQPVWRRNWFLMTNPSLFQPDPTPIGFVAPERVADSLWIRSERQTLRALPDDWLLFTIRIQQELLSDLLTTDERLEAFTKWVRDVPVETSPQRHLLAEQRPALLQSLDHRLRHNAWPVA